MKTKFKSQRKGAVLMTVTVVAAMMVIIIIAGTQLVAQTTHRTNEEYRKKQAYYVASSCLRAFVSETTGYTNATNTPEEIMAQIDQLKNIAKSGQTVEVDIQSTGTSGDKPIGETQARWNNAKCTLKVEPIHGNLNNLKAIATASYLGQDKTVVAYLEVQPIKEHTYNPKALEIIGTDGGISVKPYFNNIVVYGATGATDKDSSDENVLYNFCHNQNELYGTTDINGSIVLQNANIFGNNPYYYPTVDDSRGCVLNVSRTVIFSKNCPTFKPTITKSITDQSKAFDYNYINARQGMILTSNGAKIGIIDDPNNENFAVDSYTSLLYLGNESGIGSSLKKAVARKRETDTNVDVDAYWDKIKNGFGYGDGDGNMFNGNIYTYDLDHKAFNGDMLVYGRDTKIKGDIYLTGDLYITCPLSQFTANAIHLLPGKKIYNCARTYNEDGSIGTPTGKELTKSDLPYVKDVTNDYNWTVESRAARPELPLDHETPYYYYPEHLMCLPGDKTTVSTIWSDYKKMYKKNSDGKLWDLDTNVVKDVRSYKYEGEGFEYTDGSGNVYKPDYYVTTNCYINNLDNEKVLIDVDAANKDIIVVLKDKGSTANINVVLVRNTKNIGTDQEHFVYFVSDSGFGTVTDDYAADGKSESRYDPDSFNKPTFTFGGSGNMIMDFDSFCHSNTYTASVDGGSLNPTDDPGKDGYQIPSNNIIMLFTEGSTLKCDQAMTLLQASVYMPRATYYTTNKGRELLIEPYSTDNKSNEGKKKNMQSVCIIGNLVCHHYDVEAGNNNAIVYNEASPHSMLAFVKGFGEERADSSFRLVRYAAS